MLFTTIEFAVFLPIVFLLYWFVFNKNLRLQNLFVVIASYVFYGWWDWRFLFLIAATSLCSYTAGLLIQKHRETPKKAKAINIFNIVINLLILGVFKYYDFFATSFANAFLGGKTEGLLLHVILPVGISFYTFSAISYTIDIWQGKFEPTRDIIQYFAFISSFKYVYVVVSVLLLCVVTYLYFASLIFFSASLYPLLRIKDAIALTYSPFSIYQQPSL